MEAEAEWPGFRGPGRDGIARGAVTIETDWSVAPPVELWRRAVGPGWSSFAVQGGLVYTQEQRGEEEVVSSYDAATGELVWRHGDATRFWESNAGAGPRATPTLSGGRLYALGATGVLNALDAADGSVVWSRDLAADAEAEIPIWGFSSSPLVVGDLVLVAAAGRLVAYDLVTGEPRWVGSSGSGYSSPHRLTLDGVEQVLMLVDGGVAAVAPSDGTLLWEHAWAGGAIVQPNLTGDGEVLLGLAGMSGGVGIRRLAVSRSGGMTANAELAGDTGWTVEERWTSKGLKPYFSDFVVHEGHAYGFDGRILACIDLADGERRWKGGRYGNGQLVLLPEQDLLLVLSEKGGLALVEASPDRVYRARERDGARGQDLESPGPRRGPPAGAQRRGDGGVPAAARSPLIPRLQASAGSAQRGSSLAYDRHGPRNGLRADVLPVVGPRDPLGASGFPASSTAATRRRAEPDHGKRDQAPQAPCRLLDLRRFGLRTRVAVPGPELSSYLVSKHLKGVSRMRKNMATADRALRLILAALVAVLYFAGQISGMAAGVLGLVAVIFVVTSFVGSCPLYSLVGLSTKKG